MALVINGTTGITNPGTEQVATTIGVGNATPSASGAGITFPATQSASTDVNTLDDYEEGTFSPTVIGGTSGNASYSIQSGTYVKIGGWVYIQIYVSFTKNTISGDVQIANLPFTTKNIASQYVTVCCGYWNGLSTSILNPTSYIDSNATKLSIRKITAATTNTNAVLQNADLGAGTIEFMFSTFYLVN